MFEIFYSETLHRASLGDRPFCRWEVWGTDPLTISSLETRPRAYHIRGRVFDEERRKGEEDVEWRSAEVDPAAVVSGTTRRLRSGDVGPID